MTPLNKTKLLEQLEHVAEGEEKGDDQPLQQMGLADALLVLADVNPEREYLLSRSAAEHLLGKAPEPDDSLLEDDGDQDLVPGAH